MPGRAVNVGAGSISISPGLAPGFRQLLQQQLNALPNPTVTVNAQVNNSQLGAINRQLDDTGGHADRLKSAFAGAFAALSTRELLDKANGIYNISNKFTMATAAVTSATSAVGPLLGLVGGLGGAFAVAGAGVGAFAALAKPQITAVMNATKAVGKAQDDYNTALAQGDAKGMQKALDDRAKALAGLTPLQKTATLATLDLGKAFKAASDQMAPVSLGLYTSGVRTLTGLLPALTPIAQAAGTALQGIFTRMQAGMAAALSPTGGLGSFLTVVKEQIGPVLQGLATVAVNVGRTLSGAFQAFAPAIQPALESLGRLTERLSQAANGSGLKQFAQQAVQYLGPLEDALGNVAGGIGALIRAALPLAGPVLNAVSELGDALRNLFKSANFQTFVDNIGRAISGLTPLFAGLVGPIGQVLATISGQFANLVPVLVPVIQQFASVFANVLVGLSPLLPLFAQLAGAIVSLLPVLYPLITAFRSALVPVLGAITEGLHTLQPSIAILVDGFGKMFAAIGPVVGQLINAFVPVLGSILQAIGPVLPALGQVAAIIGGVLADAVKALQPVFAALAPLIGQLAQALVPLFADLAKVIEPLLPIVADFARQFGTALVQAAIELVKALKPIFDLLVTLSPVITAVAQAISWLVTQMVVGPLKAFAEAVGLVGKAIGAVAGFAESMGGAIGAAFAGKLEVVGTFNDGLKQTASIWTGLAATQDQLTFATNRYKDQLPGYQQAQSAYNDALKGYRQALADAQANVRSTMDAFSQVKDTANLSADAISQSVAKMTAAATAERDNIQKLLREGTPTQLIQELVGKGPEYVAAVANATDPARKQLLSNFGAYLKATTTLNDTEVKNGLNQNVNSALSTLNARKADLVNAFNSTFAQPLEQVLLAMRGSAQVGGAETAQQFGQNLLAQKDSVLNKALNAMPAPVQDAVRLAIQNATQGGGNTGHGFGDGLNSTTPYAISKADALRFGITAPMQRLLTDLGVIIVPGINRAIDGIRDHHNVVVEASGVIHSIWGFLHGGIVEALSGGRMVQTFASGGIENHTAQIAPAGAMRVWAEPETGGEAYIPLHPSKRARSLDIWARTGQALGVQGFANGGMSMPAFIQGLPPMARNLLDEVTRRLRDMWLPIARQLIAQAQAAAQAAALAAQTRPSVGSTSFGGAPSAFTPPALTPVPPPLIAPPDLSGLAAGIKGIFGFAGGGFHLMDRGGWMPHGSGSFNLSGGPEAVLTPPESAGLQAMIAGGSIVDELRALRADVNGMRGITVIAETRDGQDQGDAVARKMTKLAQIGSL